MLCSGRNGCVPVAGKKKRKNKYNLKRRGGKERVVCYFEIYPKTSFVSRRKKTIFLYLFLM